MVLIGKLQDGINKSKDNRITASKVYAELRRQESKRCWFLQPNVESARANYSQQKGKSKGATQFHNVLEFIASLSLQISARFGTYQFLQEKHALEMQKT